MIKNTTEEDLELVRSACAGDESARRVLLAGVSDVVRARVVRVLARDSRAGGAVRRQHLLDLVQDVFVLLLERQGRVLRAWDPGRGLSLEGFVGLVAEREALTFRRVGRRSAWAENPTDDIADGHDERPSPEASAEAREQLQLLLDYLSERLSPHAAQLFEALYANNLPLAEVCSRFGMTADAVYSFRTRLKRLVATFRDTVEGPSLSASASSLHSALEDAE